MTDSQMRSLWTNARRPILWPWIRSAEVRGGGDVVMRMETQQQHHEKSIGVVEGIVLINKIRHTCKKLDNVTNSSFYVK